MVNGHNGMMLKLRLLKARASTKHRMHLSSSNQPNRPYKNHATFVNENVSSDNERGVNKKATGKNERFKKATINHQLK